MLEEVKDLYQRVGGEIMWQRALQAKDPYGNGSLLINAANRNCLVSVIFLLENGADVNEKNQFGETAIHTCCKRPTKVTPQIVELFLQHGASLNEVPVFAPNTYNAYRNTNHLFSCLHRAVRSGDTAFVKFLISKGADCLICENGEHGLPPLVCSAASTEMITLLLDHGVNPKALSPKGENIFQTFIASADFKRERRRNVIQLFEQLRVLGVDPNPMGCTFTRLGIPPYIMKWLVIRSKMDVNMRDTEGNTPLIMACRANPFRNITYLLQKGADVNAQNEKGGSALYYACANNFESERLLLKVVPILLAAGAKQFPLTDDSPRNTPLHEACNRYLFDLVKLLVENGADLSQKNKKGETALDHLLGLSRHFKYLTPTSMAKCDAIQIFLREKMSNLGLN